MPVSDSYTEIFQEIKRVMFVFSHPDDAEIYAGGTIARLTADGKEVRVVKVTNGNRGSRQEHISSDDLAKIRQEEDSSAMKVLGVKPENSVYLGLEDGQVENDLQTIGLLARQIRQFKPEIIFTHNPEDKIIRYAQGVNYVNHRDHLNTGRTMVDAAYPYSRDLLFFPEQFNEPGIESHTVTKFMFVDYYGHQDTVYIDVTDFAETKTQAIASHVSQYSQQDAQESTDFFTKNESYGDKRYEQFRFVEAD